EDRSDEGGIRSWRLPGNPPVASTRPRPSGTTHPALRSVTRREAHDGRFGNDIRYVAKIVDTCDLAVDDIEARRSSTAGRLRIAEPREHLAPIEPRRHEVSVVDLVVVREVRFDFPAARALHAPHEIEARRRRGERARRPSRARWLRRAPHVLVTVSGGRSG